MKKTITIFESFAGIGSQIKALNNISKLYNFKVKSVGIIEWYIKAIIAYQIINSTPLSLDKSTPIEIIYKNLSEIYFSSDSKKLRSTKYLKQIYNQLRNIYPYFLNFLNPSLSL